MEALEEILPRNGLLYSERTPLAQILCEPRIMALKSLTLKKLEAMEKAAADDQKRLREEKKAQESAQGW